jgi:outer membrane protein assembly factor BamA
MVLSGLVGSVELKAQARDPQAPVVDTIVVIRDNVFNDEQAATSAFFRIMNSLHIRTNESFIRNNLLFVAGEPFDSARVEESERLLRKRQIFRELDIDTMRVDGRFAVVVHTQDGWSTKPKIKFSIASDGTWTGTFGVNEINLLGTGNQAYIAYVREVDRDGLNLTLNFQRLFGSEFDASGNYAGLSDGKNANWIVGVPFRTMVTRNSYEIFGMAANQRILQFFADDPAVLDTTIYQRDAQMHNFSGGLATVAQPSSYVRWVGTVGIRQEEYVLRADSGLDVPDTVTATVGAYAEYSHANFRVVRRFNGFGDEDLDLSGTLRFTLNLAPELLGYQETGIGPGISASAMVGVGSGFVWGAIDASGVFTDAGLDSGRVIMNAAFGWKPAERHALVAQIQMGALDDVRPGEEFDLGFEFPPRGWEPHSFVGTREMWVSAEHRWFIWDALLNLVGVAVAGFIDYGGAWYEGQDRRFGGTVGAGLRLGSALSTIPRTGRLDFGYRFGPEVSGDRFVVAFGAGFVFPRREIPVISYSARPPP